MIIDSEHVVIAAGRGCWAEIDPIPKHGWRRLKVHDRGPGNLTTCEMCQSAKIRYEHHMTHPKWPKVLVAGCVCSAYMELSIYFTRAKKHDIEASLDVAKKFEADVRSANRKLVTAARALARDREELDTILGRVTKYDSETIRSLVLRKWIPSIYRRALKRDVRMRAIADSISGYAGKADPHIEFLKRVETVTGEVEHLLEMIATHAATERLKAFLRDPDWYPSQKGFRATSPMGDVMQVYLDKQGHVRAMYKIKGEGPHWGDRRYRLYSEAQTRVAQALETQLKRIGRFAAQEKWTHS